MDNKKYGLLGETLGHSYSPQVHAHFADYNYQLFEKKPDEVENFIKNGDYRGLNVTIPYKKTVMQFCDELSDTAKRIGSVNTIIKSDDGKIYGHNTDYYGFMYMVKKSGIDIKDKKIIVLGNGGACATVKVALEDMKARQIVIISRKGEYNYDNISMHYDADIIVNTTPVGMYPDVSKQPVEVKKFKNCIGVLDIIYNPDKTKLLKEASSLNIKTSNGMPMLIAQAKEACEKFLDIVIPDEKMNWNLFE